MTAGGGVPLDDIYYITLRFDKLNREVPLWAHPPAMLPRRGCYIVAQGIALEIEDARIVRPERAKQRFHGGTANDCFALSGLWIHAYESQGDALCCHVTAPSGRSMAADTNSIVTSH